MSADRSLARAWLAENLFPSGCCGVRSSRWPTLLTRTAERLSDWWSPASPADFFSFQLSSLYFRTSPLPCTAIIRGKTDCCLFFPLRGSQTPFFFRQSRFVVLSAEIKLHRSNSQNQKNFQTPLQNLKKLCTTMFWKNSLCFSPWYDDAFKSGDASTMHTERTLGRYPKNIAHFMWLGCVIEYPPPIFPF